MTDEALDKRLTLIEQRMEYMQENLTQRFEHVVQSIDLRFERMCTRADFYFSLCMLTGTVVAGVAVLLALFDYGIQT